MKLIFSLINLILIFTLIIIDSNALTEKERDDLRIHLEKVGDNKEYFEATLKFLDENFDLSDEPEIVNELNKKAKSLGINEKNYRNIFYGSEKSGSLKFILWLVILILAVLIIHLLSKIKRPKDLKGNKSYLKER